jgi:hypothetical protein
MVVPQIDLYKAFQGLVVSLVWLLEWVAFTPSLLCSKEVISTQTPGGGPPYITSKLDVP